MQDVILMSSFWVNIKMTWWPCSTQHQLVELRFIIQKDQIYTLIKAGPILSPSNTFTHFTFTFDQYLLFLSMLLMSKHILFAIKVSHP